MNPACSDTVEIFKTLPGLIAATTTLLATIFGFLFAWSERLGDEKNKDPSGNVSGVVKRWFSNGTLTVIKGLLGAWLKTKTEKPVEPVAVVVKSTSPSNPPSPPIVPLKPEPDERK